MIKSKKDILSQIEELERKKSALLDKRKDEIWNLFKKRNAITIDDTILEGFLAFAMDKQNSDDPVLMIFKNRVTNGKVKKSSKPTKQESHGKDK